MTRKKYRFLTHDVVAQSYSATEGSSRWDLRMRKGLHHRCLPTTVFVSLGILLWWRHSVDVLIEPCVLFPLSLIRTLSIFSEMDISRSTECVGYGVCLTACYEYCVSPCSVWSVLSEASENVRKISKYTDSTLFYNRKLLIFWTHNVFFFNSDVFLK